MGKKPLDYEAPARKVSRRAEWALAILLVGTLLFYLAFILLEWKHEMEQGIYP